MDTEHEHRLRLRRIVAAWEAEEIDLSTKRYLINEENIRHYGGEDRLPKGLRTRIPFDEVPDVLADMLAIPREAAEQALHARRQGYRAADAAPDKTTAARHRARGIQIEYEILHGPGAGARRDATAWPPDKNGAAA